MKITNKHYHSTSFECLNEGDVFIHNDIIYIKTELVETNYSDMFNAVILKSGTLSYFLAAEMVCMVNCELIIE